MYSLSYRFSAMSTLAHANNNAVSLPGRIGSHQFAFDAAVENRGIHDEQFGSTAETFSKRRDLRGENILSDVASDQNDQLRLFQIDRLRRIDRPPEGELIADIARSLALRERRLSRVRRAIGFHQGGKETRADTMREQCNGLRPVLLSNFFQSTGKLIEGLIPGDALNCPAPLDPVRTCGYLSRSGS